MTARDTIKQYIQTEFLEPGMKLGTDHPLLETGILNSLGVMRLVAFLERTFQIRIPNADINAQNFSTMAALAEYIERRKGPDVE